MYQIKANAMPNANSAGQTMGSAAMTKDALLPGLLARLPEAPRTVALVCASRIGDFLCATPAFRALKKRLSRSKFTLIGMPFIEEMAARNRHIDDFEPCPGFPGMAEQFFDPRRALDFFQRLQARRYDFAVQMHGSGVYSNVLTLMLGARYSAGFVRAGDGPGRLDAALQWPSSLHASRRALALAVFLGAEACGEEMDLELSSADYSAARTILDGCPAPFIGLLPGSRESGKMWMPERFAETGAALQRIRGGTVVVLGGPDERLLGERIALSIGPVARNLAGGKSLTEMAGLIARLSVLIANDSGPAHMAYALAVPTVTLFGPTDPDEWGPPALLRHRVLRALDRNLSSITVKEVVREAAAAL